NERIGHGGPTVTINGRRARRQPLHGRPVRLAALPRSGQAFIPRGANRTGAFPIAMTMSGEVQLPAGRDTVWAKLNDPEVLKVCVPGCEQLDKTSDSEFQAIASIKVGPVKARWKDKIRLSDLDPPNGYRISG